jgi:hypothetical protein
MPVALIESHYLPCLEFFTATMTAEALMVESQESYQKQSYRNRCRIMTAQGVLELSVPVQKFGNTSIKQTRIDYRQKWVKDHWRSIKTAYGNAPFFEHLAGYFEEIYLQKFDYLLDLNIAIIGLCWKLLGVDMPLEKTADFRKVCSEDILDYRSEIHPKNLRKNSRFYKPCNYNQIFGKNFVGNLSIIDLLFCEGPYAYQVLLKSRP